MRATITLRLALHMYMGDTAVSQSHTVDQPYSSACSEALGAECRATSCVADDVHLMPHVYASLAPPLAFSPIACLSFSLLLMSRIKPAKPKHRYIRDDTDSDIDTRIDTDIHVDTKMEAAARRKPIHADGSRVLSEAWKEQEPFLRQHLTATLPAHMHAMLSIIIEYTRPSPQTCWEPVFAAAADAPSTASRTSGVPFRGWDVVTGAVSPPLVCPYHRFQYDCRAALVVICQLNLSELPIQLGAALGGPTRMLQVLTCPTVGEHHHTEARIVQWTGQHSSGNRHSNSDSNSNGNCLRDPSRYRAVHVYIYMYV